MNKMAEINHKDPVVRAFMLLMQSSQAAYKYSDRRFYDAGLSTATFIALRGLVSSGGVMTHGQLAAWSNTEKHNITTLVDRMKREGLVTSEYSQQDRRVSHVTITKKGRQVFDQAAPAAREIVERTMLGIGSDEATRTERILKKLRANMTENPAP